MLKFGMIGMNEGNGHPYSFSAIFNGYNEKHLEECPYEAIKTYLVNVHKNENIIPNAKVTHIWTQDNELSKNVARVSNIPNIVNNYEDMIGEVDGIILARDDPHNHWDMAKPFIENRIPIYIDKVLAHNIDDMKKIIDATGSDYPIMAGSSSRYTLAIKKAKKELDITKVKTIHGVSNVSWIRYANHLLDGICYLFGTDIESVQNIGSDGLDIVHVCYKNGPDVILQVANGLSLPIEFTCYSSVGQDHYQVLFTDIDDDFSSYFWGFYNMLNDFTKMVETGRQILPLNEIVTVTKIVIAGEISRKESGRKVKLDEIV